MVVPHYVDTQGVEPHCFDHLDPVLPVLDRDPCIVDFPSIQSSAHPGVVRCIDVGLEWLLLFCRCDIGDDADNDNHKNGLLVVLLR